MFSNKQLAGLAFSLAAVGFLAPAAQAGTVYVDREVPSQSLGADKANIPYKVAYGTESHTGTFSYSNQTSETGTFAKIGNKDIVGIKMCQQAAKQFNSAMAGEHARKSVSAGIEPYFTISSYCVPVKNSYQVADWGLTDMYNINKGDRGSPSISHTSQKAIDTTNLIVGAFATNPPSEMAAKALQAIKLTAD